MYPLVSTATTNMTEHKVTQGFLCGTVLDKAKKATQALTSVHPENILHIITVRNLDTAFMSVNTT